MNWGFIRSETFWVALGAVGSLIAAGTGIITQRAVAAQTRATRDATLADVPPPFLDKLDDPKGHFFWLRLHSDWTQHWGITDVTCPDRRARFRIVKLKCDTHGRNSIDIIGPPERSTKCRPESKLTFQLEKSNGINVSEGDVCVRVSSRSRPGLFTHFTIRI